MSQQTKLKWDRRNQQVAIPPAPTKRAQRTANRRRQPNNQFHQQPAYPYTQQQTPSAPITRGVPHPHRTNPNYKQGGPHRRPVVEVPYPQGKNLSQKRRRRRYRGSKKNLLILRFIALSVVATGLTIMSLGIYTIVTGLYALFHKPSQPQPTQPSIAQPIYSPFPIETPVSVDANSLSVPTREPGRENSEVVYNLITPPTFTPNQELQAIVNDVVSFAADRGFPTKPLSITLINAKTGEMAGYQQSALKYPASVVKMFWMVLLYAQIESGIWAGAEGFNPYISKMIQESNNEAASFIVDKISDTQYERKLKGEELQTWRAKREQLTQFFQQAGYQNININHKTYPISSLRLLEPKGSELQIRYNPNQPNKSFRNEITTVHSARLIYEVCYLKQAISAEVSKKMCGWLRRDLNPEAWSHQNQGFNPIRGFIGESLSDTNVHFYSKAGWTSGTRQEAALVETPDGSTSYILAIAADDEMYAKDWKIYPKMSRFIYERMISRR